MPASRVDISISMETYQAIRHALAFAVRQNLSCFVENAVRCDPTAFSKAIDELKQFA
jgi:hypothetical protein